MKKIYILLLGFALCSLSSYSQEVASFEDLNLAADTYWDGSDETAMFTSGGFTFINNFTDWGGYTSWDGFAYSSMTSTSYTSLEDQYNSCVGHGVNGSQTYAVVYYSSFMGTEPTIIANDAETFVATGCYVTNNAYAYESMVNGDSYCKKFDENDWFLLTATGYLNGEVTESANYYLASNGEIVNDWKYFDLTALGTVDEIHFTLSSSDTGTWGMNTPAYFCMDNFGEAPNATHISMTESVRNEKMYDILGRNVKIKTGLRIQNNKLQFVK